MTRKSVIARDVKRQKTVERYAAKRAALKEAFLNPENSYEEKMAAGQEPDNINKEFLRLWLAGQGYIGEGEVPAIPEDVLIETSRRYIEAYELITGQKFKAEVGDVSDRVHRSLKDLS